MSEPDISTLARRLAEQNNVDWRALHGSGPSGKVVERDVLDYLARVMAGDEAVDPTPEPLPAGMQAWPDQDLAEFRQGVSESASSLGDLRSEIGSAARSEPELGAAVGLQAQEAATATANHGGGMGSMSVTDGLADDDGVSEDIFLFDDEASDESSDAYPAAPYVEVPASVIDDDDDLLDDDLLVAGDDGQVSSDELDGPSGSGEGTGFTDAGSAWDAPAGARSDGSGAFGSLSAGSLAGDDAGDEDLFAAADGGLTFDGFGSEPSFGTAAAEASNSADPSDSFAGGWGESTRLGDEPSDWERLNGVSSGAGDGSDDDLPDLFTGDSDAESELTSVAEVATQEVADAGSALGSEGGSYDFGLGEETEDAGAESAEAESDELQTEELESDEPTSAEATEAVFDESAGSAGVAEEVEMEEAAEQPGAYAVSGAGVEPAVVAAAAAQGLDIASREDPALAALPLARPAMLLRRHIDVSALASAQFAVGQELGEDEPLGAAPFLLRAVAKAAMETGFTRNPVALAVIDGGIRLRRVDEAATRSFGSLVGELQAGGQDEDEAGLVAADLSGIDVDEVVLELGVPVVTLGRILYDTQRGAYRSTLALAGDVPLEIGAKLLARVAELLDAPVRLVL